MNVEVEGGMKASRQDGTNLREVEKDKALSRQVVGRQTKDLVVKLVATVCVNSPRVWTESFCESSSAPTPQRRASPEAAPGP